jgi:cytochrome b
MIRGRVVGGVANEVVRFMLELVLIGVFAWWAWHAGSSFVVSLLFAVIAVVAAGVVWGMFGAPRSRFKTPQWGRSLLIYLYGVLATLCLADLGHVVAGIVLLVLVVINDLLLIAGLRTVGRPMVTD